MWRLDTVSMGEINFSYDTRPYVLTGGSGVGKTSVAIGLELEGYFTIHEVAESYIKYQQLKGVDRPWEDKDFEKTILRYQIYRESVLNQYNPSVPVFVDRGTIDTLAYCQLYKKPISELMEQVLFQHRNKHVYEKVFILEQLDSDNKTTFRKENLVESKNLEILQERNYQRFGYPIIRVPTGPVEDRVKYIISQLI